VAVKNGNGNGGLAFSVELFKAADELRGNLEPYECKHVALSKNFLKYISDTFKARRAKLSAGRVYDPCRGSGAMFIEEHGGRRDAMAVYRQEINHTSWRLAKMNLAKEAAQ
jgi:type I restriction-modification system DNA methylase subunit